MLHLTEDQKAELERWVHSRSLAAGDIQRARLILALAEGHSYSNIISRLRTTAPTIARWKKRFEELGIDGLEGRHKGGSPRVVGVSAHAEIASLILENSYDPSLPSYRKIASETSLSKSTIQRICAKNHYKPHRLDYYVVRSDRSLKYKPSNIMGLYLHSSQHAAAFSVHEPFSPDRGTQSLRFALDEGGPSSALSRRQGIRQFAQFRDAVLSRAGATTEIHLILDNPSAHKTIDVELFLAAHPRVHMHFLRSYAEWVQHTDLWFSKPRDESGDSGVFGINNLRKYLRLYAKSATGFRWIAY